MEMECIVTDQLCTDRHRNDVVPPWWQQEELRDSCLTCLTVSLCLEFNHETCSLLKSLPTTDLGDESVPMFRKQLSAYGFYCKWERFWGCLHQTPVQAQVGVQRPLCLSHGRKSQEMDQTCDGCLMLLSQMPGCSTSLQEMQETLPWLQWQLVQTAPPRVSCAVRKPWHLRDITMLQWCPSFSWACWGLLVRILKIWIKFSTDLNMASDNELISMKKHFTEAVNV